MTLFDDALAAHGPAVQRMCRAIEHDPTRRADLEQEVWLAVWRALPRFRGEASVRTFVLRIAHNVGATHALTHTRDRLLRAVPLEDLAPDGPAPDELLDRRWLLARVYALVDRLATLDRQVLLLWLEGLPQAEIAAVTGLSETHVSTKIHRVKRALAARVGGKP